MLALVDEQRPPAGTMELGQSPLQPLRFCSGMDDRIYVLSFVKNIPLNYIATGSSSQRTLKPKDRDPSAPEIQFDQALLIIPPDPHAPFEFELFWTNDAKIIKLFFRPKKGFPSPPPDCRRWGLDVHAVIPGQPLISVSPLVGFDRSRVINTRTFPNSHPFHRLCASFMHRNHRALIDACVLDVVPPAIYGQFVRNQIRNLVRADILGFLEKVSLGSTKVWISHKKDSLMEPTNAEKTEWLFGVTQVFPWVIHMLTECNPSCIMTDATFYFFDPYILEILHVIVRNESMPIAVAVFPTETANSYFRLYSHVLEVLEKYGVDTKVLTDLPLVSDHGPGLRGFIAQLRDEKHIMLRWLLCHRHLIENAGASSIVGEWVRLLLLCCTGAECIETARAVVLEIAKLDDVQSRKFRDAENHHLIKNMLTAINDEFKLNLTLDWDPLTCAPLDWRVWARWVREGCPTTSNAAESIHRWLNDLAAHFGNARFISRYQSLIKYIHDRFTDRDLPDRCERRSTARLATLLKKPALSSRDQTLRAFNLKLHGEQGKPWDEKTPCWAFPRWKDSVPGRDLKGFSTHDAPDPLPTSWLPDRPVPLDPLTAGALGLLDLEMPDDSQFLAGAGLGRESDSGGGPQIPPVHPVDPGYHNAAWKIIYCIRRITSNVRWEARGGYKVVVATVFHFGERYRSGSPTLEDQVNWKFDVLGELRLPVVV
jgi:hypothetical protein